MSRAAMACAARPALAGAFAGGPAEPGLGPARGDFVAPIGAIVGEWVGASAGLTFTLHANGRMQIDVMFAALLALAVLAIAFISRSTAA